MPEQGRLESTEQDEKALSIKIVEEEPASPGAQGTSALDSPAPSSAAGPVIAEGGGPIPVTSATLEAASPKTLILPRSAAKLKNGNVNPHGKGQKPSANASATYSKGYLSRSVRVPPSNGGINHTLLNLHGNTKKSPLYTAKGEASTPEFERNSCKNLDDEDSSDKTSTMDVDSLCMSKDGSGSETSTRPKFMVSDAGSMSWKTHDNGADSESFVGSQTHDELEVEGSKLSTYPLPHVDSFRRRHSDGISLDHMPAIIRAHSSAASENEELLRAQPVSVRKDHLLPLPADRSFRFKRAASRRSSAGTIRSRAPSIAETQLSKPSTIVLTSEEEFDFLEKHYVSVAKHYGGMFHRKMIWEWGQSINTSISILLRSSMPFRAALARWWVSLIMILGAMACLAWHTAAAVNVASWNKGYTQHRKYRFTALELREPYSASVACGAKTFTPGLTECLPATPTDVLWPGIESFGLLLDGCTVQTDKAVISRSSSSIMITFPEPMYMNGWYIVTPMVSNPKYDAVRFKLEADDAEAGWILVGSSGWSKSSFGVCFYAKWPCLFVFSLQGLCGAEAHALNIFLLVHSPHMHVLGKLVLVFGWTHCLHDS